MVTAKAEDTVFNSFAKAGPWALLCLIMLLGVGWKANDIIDAYMAYVSESRIVMSSLTTAMADVNKVHASQLESLDTLQEAAVSRSSEHVQHEKLMQDILALMQEARTLMEDVPNQRQEQLVILQRIDAGIQQLTNLLQDTPPIGDPN